MHKYPPTQGPGPGPGPRVGVACPFYLRKFIGEMVPGEVLMPSLYQVYLDNYLDNMAT